MMTWDRRTATSATSTDPSLTRAREQNEKVKEKVADCADELAVVNEVLKREAAEGAPSKEATAAIRRSEWVESKVQECAAELETINSVLDNGIDERSHLERRLSSTAAALSESNARAEEARYLALHDALTRLPNMSLFEDRLDLALAQAKRYQRRFAVMFIDLDGFKAVNDTHGHDVGDRVLQNVADRLQSAVRSGDTVSRRSGDEFLFLMMEAKDEATVANLALKIGAAVAVNCEIEGVSVGVAPSIGIALYPEDGLTDDDLLKNADTAMYFAKQEKSGHAFFSRLPA
ncbi:MAG: GGDEF domain-containing protein [Vicinamibacteria bacterium]